MRLALAILMFGLSLYGATTNCPNANLSTVQNAINAMSDGDTVNIPSGTVTWSGQLSVTKAISLIGAGTNSTVINNSAGSVIYWKPVNDKFCRLSGITLVSQPGSDYIVQLRGPSYQFRVDHCLFHSGIHVLWTNPEGGGTTGPVYGVIDHNTFLNCQIGVMIEDCELGEGSQGPPPMSDGQASWSRAMPGITNVILPGTTNAMYVEANSFVWDANVGTDCINCLNNTESQVYGQSGARAVIRNNTFNASTTGGAIDGHGDQGSLGGLFSVVQYEVYSNTITGTFGGTCSSSMNFRGGQHLVWSNNFTCDNLPLELIQYYTNAPNWQDRSITNTYYWGNIYNGGGNQTNQIFLANIGPPGCQCSTASIFTNINFKYFPPQSGQPFFPYTPLVYPHPLVSGGGGSGSPVITFQPIAVTNFSGTTLSLSVIASGAAPLSYQWRLNTNSISGSTSSSFTSNNVQTTSSGWYDCVVTNASGSATSSIVYVQITNAPPTIVTQPTGQTNGVGASFTLSTTATGSSPLFYQWRQNALALTGATSSSYTTNNAQTNNSGFYTCLVTNNYGSVTTAQVYVDIQPDLSPKFAAQWTNSALTFNSYNTSVTVSGTKPMLVAFVHSYSSGGNKVTNVTFNSVNMTQLFRTNYYSSNGALDIWYMANPPSVSANVIISGTAVAESLVIIILVTNAPTVWALFEPPQANYYSSAFVTGTDTINQSSLINELVLDAVVSASYAFNPSSPQTLINRVTQSTQTFLQSSWNRSLGVYTPMTWGTSASADTITHVSVSIAQAHPNALPTKLTISNIRVSNIKLP